MIQNVDFITDFIFVEDSLSPCNVILVPGGSHAQLAEKAAELYTQGMGKYILFSGRANLNIPDHSSEADWLKTIAINNGVPPDRIICETKASHTFENAEYSLALLRDMHILADSIILVCKAYHARRALLSYQYYFPGSTKFLVTTITDKRGLNRDNWTTKKEYIDKVMTEVEKIGKYFKDKLL